MFVKFSRVFVFWFYIFISFSFDLYLHSIFWFVVKMIFLNCFTFVVQNRFNYIINRVNNQIRQQQFVVWMNFYEIIILLFVNSTETTFKKIFNDITVIVNNCNSLKKQRKRFKKSTNDSRIFSNNVFAFYNFIFFEFVVVRFRHKIYKMLCKNIILLYNYTKISKWKTNTWKSVKTYIKNLIFWMRQIEFRF